MIEFPLHTLETAPASSRAVLASAGMPCSTLPNMLRTMAESPATLKGFEALRHAFSQSSLTPLEQQVVYLTVAQKNACHYCTTQINMFDGSEEAQAAAEAIRAERPLGNRRLQALRRFTAEMTTERGWASDAVVAGMLDAGFTHGQVLDTIAGIALATMTSYVNHVAATPIDGPAPRATLDA
jgi:alkylhydroperoxidase family enzyme